MAENERGYDPKTRNKNIRAMAWLAFIAAMLATFNGMFMNDGKFPPDYFYGFCSIVIGMYMGVSKWGEINNR